MVMPMPNPVTDSAKGIIPWTISKIVAILLPDRSSIHFAKEAYPP